MTRAARSPTGPRPVPRGRRAPCTCGRCQILTRAHAVHMADSRHAGDGNTPRGPAKRPRREFSSRALRAALFTALCTALSTASHVLLSHHPLPPVPVLAICAGVFAAAYALTGRECGFGAVAALLVPLELAADTVFTAGQHTCYGEAAWPGHRPAALGRRRTAVPGRRMGHTAGPGGRPSGHAPAAVRPGGGPLAAARRPCRGRPARRGLAAPRGRRPGRPAARRSGRRLPPAAHRDRGTHRRRCPAPPADPAAAPAAHAAARSPSSCTAYGAAARPARPAPDQHTATGTTLRGPHHP